MQQWKMEIFSLKMKNNWENSNIFWFSRTGQVCRKRNWCLNTRCWLLPEPLVLPRIRQKRTPRRRHDSWHRSASCGHTCRKCPPSLFARHFCPSCQRRAPFSSFLIFASSWFLMVKMRMSWIGWMHSSTTTEATYSPLSASSAFGLFSFSEYFSPPILCGVQIRSLFYKDDWC